MSVCLNFAAPPAGSMGLAISGGSDSMALFFSALAQFGANRLYGVTVEHGLREGAAQEALFVAKICAANGVHHKVLKLKNLTHGSNLQARARAARYDALTAWAKEHSIQHICLGHSQTDVAETFLLRLARGSGVSGLAALAPAFKKGDVTFHRPLLHESRENLQAFLKKMGQGWCNDPSNRDTAFERVKIRQALPTFAELGLDAAGLANTAQRLAKARDVLHSATQTLAQSACTQVGNAICIDLKKLEDAAPDLTHRLYAWAVQWVAGAEYAPRAAALQRFVMSEKDATLGGCVGVKTKDAQHWIGREYAKIATLPSAKEGNAWDQKWQIDALGAIYSGVMLAPLGPHGYRQIKAHSPPIHILPRKIALSAPSLWQGDSLLSCPMLGYGEKDGIKSENSFKEFLSNR